MRALIVGRADEERVVELADDLIGVKLRAGDTVLMDSRTGLLLEKLARPEVEELRARGGARHLLRRRRRPRRARSRRSPTPSSCRSCTASCSSSTSCRRPRASCSTALPAAARRSSPRRWPTRSPRRWPRSPATRRRAATSSTSRAPSCSTSTSARPSARSASCSSGPGRSREEGVPVIVFFDEMDSLFRTRGTGISSDMESTIVPQLLAEIDGVETLQQRDRDRRVEPRGPHRPGHPAARAVST